MDEVSVGLGKHSKENAEAKFRQRASAIMDKPTFNPIPGDAPAWLMPAPDMDQAAAQTNTEDIMEEFLQDEDMLHLELLCSKWKGIDETEIASIEKLMPDTARHLIQGNKHMEEFLSYRRQVGEKLERKSAVKHKLKQLQRPKEDDDDDDFGNEEEGPMAPAPSIQQEEAMPNRPKDNSVMSSSSGAASVRKSSVMMNLPNASRRMSMTSPRLSVTGANIVGQEKQNGPDSNTKRLAPISEASKNRRSSQNGRRMSVVNITKAI